MLFRDLALEGLQQTLNRVIGLDPRAVERLAALHGRVVRVAFDGTGIAFNMVPGHDGRLQLLAGDDDVPPACTLSGSLLDLMRASRADDGSAQLFSGHVRIDGDLATARAFSEALAELDIDWEEALSRLTGDVAAHEIGRRARALSRQASRLGAVGADNLSEYLTEEARLLPHPLDVEAFVADVDRLRDDVARLEARIGLLQDRATDPDP